MIESTDEFISSLPSPQREIIEALRELIVRAGPNLRETLKWGYPCYVGTGNVCAVMPFANHVHLEFFHGSELSSGLLEGTGMGMRHVRVRSVAEVRARTLGPLLKEAIKLDAGELATT